MEMENRLVVARGWRERGEREEGMGIKRQNVHLKLTQCCKSTILQLKKKKRQREGFLW